MIGDATADEVLLEAGIAKAQGMVCALSEDAYNVFIVLTARAISPNIKIVSRAERPESVEKMRRAGADKVISPAQIGGYQMAMSMLKPATVDLVDTLFANHNLQLQLEEIVINADSKIANREIREVFDRQHTNVILVSIIRGDKVIMIPRGNDLMLPGDTLVIIGDRGDLEGLENTILK
jgi:voltage-gated potassium channel